MDASDKLKNTIVLTMADCIMDDDVKDTIASLLDAIERIGSYHDDGSFVIYPDES